MVVTIVLTLAAAMIAFEIMRPGRRWPKVDGWWRRAALINGFQIVAVFIAGMTWDRWLRQHSLWSVSRLGFGAELAIGYLAEVLWLYWAHRVRHEVPFLWRHLHQLHHSPQRIEILTAFYKHPLEIVLESFIGAALLYAMLGLSPRAVLIISIVSGTLNLIYHWNVATPRWLGYLIQRPESHCVHHQQDVHAYNYSELPIIDIIFGTFRNPLGFDGRCGFGSNREARFAELLIGRDVNLDTAPHAGVASIARE